jgi:hypothetical protein
MLNRKLILALLSVAAIGATAYAATATYSRITYETNPPITAELVRKIKLGMTPEEVLRIVGRKTEQHTAAKEQSLVMTGDYWSSDDLTLHVLYMHGVLTQKIVRDDKLFPKTTLILELSQEMSDAATATIFCAHDPECSRVAAEMEKDGFN